MHSPFLIGKQERDCEQNFRGKGEGKGEGHWESQEAREAVRSHHAFDATFIRIVFTSFSLA